MKEKEGGREGGRKKERVNKHACMSVYVSEGKGE